MNEALPASIIRTFPSLIASTPFSRSAPTCTVSSTASPFPNAYVQWIVTPDRFMNAPEKS
jgi:hypothetical protein